MGGKSVLLRDLTKKVRRDLVDHLPAPIAELIDSEPGKGFQLRLTSLA